MAKAVDEAMLTSRSFKFKMPVLPRVLDDIELQRIQIPALLIVGEDEKIYSVQNVIQRIENVAPQIETEIIANAGHDLTYVQADIVNRKVLDFLRK